jgi:hypothetical protein
MGIFIKEYVMKSLSRILRLSAILFFMLFALIFTAPVFAQQQDQQGSILPDAFNRPPEVQAEIAAAEAGQALSLPGYYDTSVFMTGKIAIGIILPESTGSQENWTTAERDNVVSQIQTGMNWWKTQGGTAANLSFSYDIQYGIPTSYEPITLSSAQDNLWIGDVMNNMGYNASTSYFSRVYAYVNHIRDQYAANWAFAVFVVRDISIPSHEFSDGYFAYAYLGGPFMVMTYNNDGWGINNMQRVAAHEVGHIFGAGDQYYQAGYGGCTSKTERYGYLGILNSNCDYGGATGIPSIMKDNTYALDTTAHDQVGWRDSNSNGAPDPIDDLVITLSAYTPNPTAETSLTYNGSAQNSAYPHAVCTGTGDVCYDHDVYLPQAISNVEYRADSGTWSNATPVDGAFNSDLESFSFTVPLGSGTHIFNARVTGSLGATSLWSDTVASTDPLGLGKYDDTNPSWSYSGAWTAYSGTGPYNGTLHYTGTVGASAYFKFAGKQFILTYTGNSNRGSFEVWVDGGKETTINAYNATLTWQQTYTSTVYSSRTHTVMVKNVGGGSYVDVDAIQIDPDMIAPSGVGSLSAATGTSTGSIDLSWIAPMNDAGNAASGPVSAYLVRYSTTNIVSEADWNAATPVTTGIPTPGAVGASQNMTVSGLTSGMRYYIAVRGQDGQPNLGPIVTASALPKAPAPVGVGTYDDAHSAWIYAGTWSTYTGTGPYAGTLHYTDVVNSMGSFTFSGVQFVLTYTGDSSRGSFEVWVDGSLVTTVNAYSASTSWQKKYVSPIYASGTHTVVIRKVGSGRTDIDAIQVIDYMGAGVYDDAFSTWVYTGTWNTYTGTGPYAGTLHYTDTIDSAAIFRFTGAQFILTYTGDSSRGSFEVWVDGGWVTTVNAYNATTSWQRTYVSTIYPSGQHMVMIKNAGSGRTDVDAIQIDPDMIAPSAVGSLSAVTGSSTGSINLSWTAPMNDAGNAASGPVSAYLVRYSTTNIASESDWNAATPVTTGIPTPGAVGASQSMTVSGLAPGLTYYIAVRGQDTSNLGPIITASALPKAPAAVGAGMYDDAHTAWIYAGTWSTYSGSGPYNNTLHYNSTAGNAASFTFSGNRFILTYTAYNNRGSFEVWVDGTLVTTVNAYNASPVWQRTYTSPIYSNGVHTVAFKNTGSSVTDVDAIQIIAPDLTAPAAVGALSATNGTSSGSVDVYWVSPAQDAGNAASGPVSAYLVRYSTTNIASESDWNAATQVTSGIPAPAAVDFAQSMTISGLTPGTTYYIAVRGQDAEPNLGPIVTKSAVASSPVPMGAGMYDDSNPAWTYSSGWSTYSGPGPYNNTLHYNSTVGATASFLFSGTQFVLSYTAYTNRGSFEVWVDGGLVTTINANSAFLVWQKTYISPVYTVGTHTVMLKNVGPSGITDVDAIQVIVPVGAGMYDDADAAWVYENGTWSSYTGSGPYAGTLHYNDTIGATASLTFSGTQFILSYTAYNNRGSFEVWVDGALETTINAYSASLVWQKAYTSPIYSNGVHTVMLKNIGGSAYQDVDAIQIVAPVGAGIYDDTNSAWLYDAGWSTYSGSGPYNNTLHYNGTAGTTASLTFSGTQFILSYTAYNNRGSFEVWVDGGLVTTINAYSASLVWQKTYTSPQYSAGVHTVMLKDVGGSAYQDVDAIQIISPVTAGMYDDTHAGWTYAGTWTTYSGAGPYNNTLHYSSAVGSTASFAFNGTQFVLSYAVYSNRGSFEVWVDGVYVTTVNAYNASLLWQKAYISPVYSAGNHTVLLKNVGPSGVTDVDAIRILP